MNRVFYLLVILCFLNSCREKDNISNGKSLDITPNKINETVESLYNSGVAELYVKADKKQGVVMAWGAYRSGLFESEAVDGPYNALHLGYEDTPELKILSEYIYKTCNDAIVSANSIIKELSIVGVNIKEKDNFIAIAKFFRAFNMFYLLKSFGNIPNGEKSSTPLDYYNNIVKDLQEAVVGLSDNTSPKKNSIITSDIARVVLAEVYLQMSGKPYNCNKYLEAADILQPLLSSGKYRLASSAGNDDIHSAYNILRTNYNNTEYLYTINSETAVTRSNFSYPKNAQSWNNVKTDVAFNAYQPTNLFLSFYSNNDLRVKDYQFFHTFHKSNQGKKTTFEIFNAAPYFWLNTGIGGQASSTQLQQIGVYRYAEVLLIAAEAIAMSNGVTSQAIDCLVSVRERACGKISSEELQRLQSLSKDDFVKEIWKERLCELPFEMKQLQDIQRTRFYPTIKDSVISFVLFDEAITPANWKFTDRKLFLPLPKGL